MATLQECDQYDINWELTPEDAVTIYLEWGNNDWHASRPPVRSKSDASVYFVVDAWEETPVIRLVRRTSEGSEDLLAFPMPAALLPDWRRENGNARGVFFPGRAVVTWLQEQMSRGGHAGESG